MSREITSQSAPGTQQQGARPVLHRAREAAPYIATGGLITIGVVCLCMVGWVKYVDYQAAQLQNDTNAQQAQTEAGAFAVDHFLQCKQEPIFPTFVNTNSDCSNLVVEAAKNLKGDQVAGEVTRHLGTWLEKSTRIHALRLDAQRITNFIAKYGFRLAGLLGNVAFQGRPR